MAPRKTSGFVVAKEAIVINVGGRPPVYRELTVTHNKTGEKVKILDTDNEPKDAGDLGIPYAFKELQKVPKNHPAVKECPGAFIPLEEAEEMELVS
jgi:hypothetical protein